jgi:hypothetical protein
MRREYPGITNSRSTKINTKISAMTPGEIQISENEMASDSDRHRSLNRHRSVRYAEKTLIAPPSIIEVRELLIRFKSIFSHAGLAVMI